MNNITRTKFSCHRDGLTIRGYVYKPQGDNLPIAIVSHPFMANSMIVKHYAKFFAEMGYVAFCFDFCGGCLLMGRSDGKTTEMSVLTEVSDLCAVIEYAKSLNYTDSSNILLMGCSQGGLVSAIAASKLKNQISKIVLFYPALCIPDDARSGKMILAKFNPNNVPDLIKCGPMKLGRSYVTDVLNMNPFEEIKGYQGDVLIVHGTKDRIVASHYVDKALRIYSSRKEGSAKLHFISGGKHIFSKKHDKLAIEYIKDFIHNDSK